MFHDKIDRWCLQVTFIAIILNNLCIRIHIDKIVYSFCWLAYRIQALITSNFSFFFCSNCKWKTLNIFNQFNCYQWWQLKKKKQNKKMYCNYGQCVYGSLAYYICNRSLSLTFIWKKKKQNTNKSHTMKIYFRNVHLISVYYQIHHFFTDLKKRKKIF